jgi:hypothetical protein
MKLFFVFLYFDTGFFDVDNSVLAEKVETQGYLVARHDFLTGNLDLLLAQVDFFHIDRTCTFPEKVVAAVD